VGINYLIFPRFPRSQVEPGNENIEALPLNLAAKEAQRLDLAAEEAEPPGFRSQVLPGNEKS